MKVAQKSPEQSSRATLTLNRDVYLKMDSLRGRESRSAWVAHLIEEEKKRQERFALAETLRNQYSGLVIQQTLQTNEEFPIHEE